MFDEMFRARKKKKMTQLDLAKEIGVTEEYICLIENRKRRPSPDVAKKIAKKLKLKWTIFFE